LHLIQTFILIDMNARKKKWMLISGIVAVAAVVAFFTNPGPSAHREAIITARDLLIPNFVGNTFQPYLSEYHNYGVFSTYGGGGMIFSYCYFGRVQTTDDVRLFNE